MGLFSLRNCDLSRHRLTIEQRLHIVALCEEESPSVIAQRYKLKTNTIWKWCRKLALGKKLFEGRGRPVALDNIGKLIIVSFVIEKFKKNYCIV